MRSNITVVRGDGSSVVTTTTPADLTNTESAPQVVLLDERRLAGAGADVDGDNTEVGDVPATAPITEGQFSEKVFP